MNIPMNRPQDRCAGCTGLTFETLEHGGEYPDGTPQAIRVTYADGRSRIYVPSPDGAEVIEFDTRR